MCTTFWMDMTMKAMRSGWKHIALCSMLALVACVDDSYRGYEIDYEDYKEGYTVSVAVGDPYAVRGTGPKNYINDLSGCDVLVWAFNRAEDTPFTAVRTKTDSLQCLIDGKATTVVANNSLTVWKEGSVYYPSEEQVAERYDFYGAFIDDATVLDQHRASDKVQLDIEIDGSQDVMTSKAGLPRYASTGEVKDYAFSYLSSKEGDVPIFTLNHHLTKLDLFVRPGITYGFSNTMTITGANLETRTQGTLTVAAKDTDNMGMVFWDNAPYKQVILRNQNGEACEPVTLQTINTYDAETGVNRYVDDPYLLQLQKDATRQMGASFFVAPEKTYTLNLTFKDPDPRDDPFPNTVRLNSGEAFLPGHHYQVTMTVYGSYQIDIDCIMVPWLQAGSIWVDKDRQADEEDGWIGPH